MASTWTIAGPERSTAGVRMVGHAVAAGILLLLTFWALQFQLQEPPVPLIWAASAVALSAAYRLGNAAALTVALVVLVVHLARGAAPVGAILVALGTGASGVIGAQLLRRWRFDPGLGRTRDLGLLLAVGGGVSAGLSAFAGSLTIAGLETGFAETFGLCWIADSMGMLLIAPALLSVSRPWRVDGESVAWILGVPLVVYGIYAGGFPQMLAVPASYAVFPLIMAVALRRPIPVVTVVLMAVAAIAITCTASGKGPFAQADMRPNMLALHAHLAMLALTGLLLAAIRSERREAENRAREHLRMLARAGRISALSTMAAGIAHEINQPLCAVQAYAQTARRLAGRGAGTDEIESVLERIVGGTDRVAAIVRRMRGFLRGGEATREDHDLNDLVVDALELVRPECSRQGVAIRLELAASALPVRVDAVEVQQVVVNLVQNALDALADDAEAHRRWVSVATRWSPDRQPEMVVSDGGRGLPAGDHSALFEPLSEGHNGSGLGLPIVRSIVEAHGGDIQAANAPDAGAVFWVRLPAAATHRGD